MTVSVQTPAKASTANGLTTVFPYDFRILDKSHLRVTGTLDGVTTDYAVDVDFTVDGVGNAGGGNVTFGVAPAAGAVILRKRVMPFVRDTDYQNNGDLLSTEFNADQDAPVMMLQELREGLGRALSVPEHVVGFDGLLPTPVPQAPLVVNADGNGFDFGDTGAAREARQTSCPQPRRFPTAGFSFTRV